MNVGSLFSGIGGLELGLERAGMTVKWQVEMDDYATRVLEKHWPTVTRFRDVRECGKHNLEPIDLICGGFPCQPFSLAGEQRGASDDRYLWPEMLRIISELKPAFVMAENVYGFVALERGVYIEKVLTDLEAIGYETLPPIVIPACALDADHRRDRVFIIAHTNSQRGRPEQVSQQGSSYPSKPGNDGEKESLADSTCPRLTDIQGSQENARLSGQRTISYPSWWHIEPNVGRVANGVPKRVDRIRCLGNAVVPQVAEFLGRMILKSRLLSRLS